MRTAGKRGTAIERRPGVFLIQCSRPGGKKVSKIVKTEARYKPGTIPLPVQKELTALLAEVDAYKDAEADQSTFAQVAASWLADNELAPSTRYSYVRYLEREILPRWGKTPVSEVTAKGLSDWYRDLHKVKGLSPATVRQIHAIIRGILKLAVRDGVGGVTVNMATQAALPSGGAAAQAAVKAPTPEEVATLMGAAAEDRDFYVYLVLSAALGSRRGETTALRWLNIDWDEGAVEIDGAIDGSPFQHRQLKPTKTHAEGVLAVGEKVMAVLRSYRQAKEMDAELRGITLRDDSYLFSRHVNGQEPWYPGTATAKFADIRAKAGLGAHVQLKNLRHFHATQLLSNGVDVSVVAGRLRHASAATTFGFYAKRDQKADRRAADLFDGVL